MKRAKSVSIALATGLGVVALAAPALAVRSTYSGGGYSEDVEASLLIQACDTNRDGNGVYAQYYRRGWSNYQEVRNNQGSGTCEVAGTVNPNSQVTRHRISIDLSARPDPSGPWKNTGF